MGRGGRGGGGRSSGGGGRSSSRSSGGRSSGASRGGYTGRASRGGYSGARTGSGHRRAAGSRGINHRPPPRPAPPLFGMPPRPTRRRRAYYGGGAAYTGRAFANAMTIAGVLVVTGVVFAAIIAISFAAASPSGITKSTARREKLASQYVTTTEWYTDELGWINSGTKLTRGMRSFYNETGVQPYLYITDTVNGTNEPSDEDMEIYAQALYEELFDDEGHILLLFYEWNSDTNYKTRYVCGAMAKSVMDSEACDILLDYIDAYYFSDLQDDEMFSSAFEKAGSRIMSVTRSPAPFVILAAIVLLIIVLAFKWWTKSVEQRNREAEERERILSADIGSVNDPELKDLEDKYSGKSTE